MLPSLASTAMMQSEHRLSPGRTEPSRSGDGLPTAKNNRCDAGSYVGVIHTPPPPRCHASPYCAIAAFSASMLRCNGSPSLVVGVNFPSHPLSNTVCADHSGWPLLLLCARTNPPMPYSPPEMPTITLSPTISGAIVSLYPASGSSTCTSHCTAPVFASSATRCASSVAMNTVPSEIATQRLFGPQQ